MAAAPHAHMTAASQSPLPGPSPQQAAEAASTSGREPLFRGWNIARWVLGGRQPAPPPALPPQASAKVAATAAADAAAMAAWEQAEEARLGSRGSGYGQQQQGGREQQYVQQQLAYEEEYYDEEEEEEEEGPLAHDPLRPFKLLLAGGESASGPGQWRRAWEQWEEPDAVLGYGQPCVAIGTATVCACWRHSQCMPHIHPPIHHSSNPRRCCPTAWLPTRRRSGGGEPHGHGAHRSAQDAAADTGLPKGADNSGGVPQDGCRGCARVWIGCWLEAGALRSAGACRERCVWGGGTAGQVWWAWPPAPC